MMWRSPLGVSAAAPTQQKINNDDSGTAEPCNTPDSDSLMSHYIVPREKSAPPPAAIRPFIRILWLTLVNYTPVRKHCLKYKHYKLLSLTYEVFTTIEVHKRISVQLSRSTCSSFLGTLARPPTSSSLTTTERPCRYASPSVWSSINSTSLIPVLSWHLARFTSHFFCQFLTPTVTVIVCSVQCYDGELDWATHLAGFFLLYYWPFYTYCRGQYCFARRAFELCLRLSSSSVVCRHL